MNISVNIVDEMRILSTLDNLSVD